MPTPVAFEARRGDLQGLIDSANLLELVVGYEELVESPSKTVERLYEQFGLPLAETFASELRREESRAQQHRSEHVYNLEEFGLTRSEIREALPEAFERFGWDPPDADAPPPLRK